MIRECLDLRKAYVYKEIAPWRKEAIPESYSSKTSTDPFHFDPVEASSVSGFLFIFFKNLETGSRKFSAKVIYSSFNCFTFLNLWKLIIFIMQHCFRMEDGVVHVYASENGKSP